MLAIKVHKYITMRTSSAETRRSAYYASVILIIKMFVVLVQNCSMRKCQAFTILLFCKSAMLLWYFQSQQCYLDYPAEYSFKIV